jgi:hypothetical protein
MMTFSKTKDLPSTAPAPRQSRHTSCTPGSYFLAALGMLALCGLLVSCDNKTDTVPPPAPATNAAPSAAAVSPELAKLVGKWERPDGGYVVEIKGVDPSGKLDVAYFNPNPINVSRAVAWRDQGTTRVVIELRDENYPGCTYNLKHDPQSDQLYGQYFQAAMQETFDVAFARLK